MKKKFKKIFFSSGLALLLLTLSGCVQTNSSGQPTGEGWVYKLLVHPMSEAVQFFAQHVGYGVAIIIITLIVRTIILPLGLNQSKKMMLQQEKMQAIQPEMMRLQKMMQTAQTEEEKMRLNVALGKLMKDNNISMLGGMGCLPLILQMPIFTALFYAARYTPGISDATFLGISLGKPSLLLTVLAGAAYLLQGYLSMLSVPKAQRAQMKMTIIMSPLMIVFMSFSSPAGVTLYWVIGGLFSCIQTLITNFYHKPKIKQQVAEQLKKNPPTTHVDVDNVVPEDMAERYREKHPELQETPHGNQRNAGKQNHHEATGEQTAKETPHGSQRNAGRQHRHSDNQSAASAENTAQNETVTETPHGSQRNAGRQHRHSVDQSNETVDTQDHTKD